MADTGAPWNIPYVESTDLVSDYPTDSLALANAVAGGLDDLGSGGIGSNVVSVLKTDVFSGSSTPPALIAVTGLTADITPTSDTSKVLVIVTLSAQSEDPHPVVVQVLRDGSDSVARGDAASNRSRRFGAIHPDGGTQASNAAGNATFVFLDSPATTSELTYSVSVHGTGTAPEIIYVNRSRTDTDSNRWIRSASSITLIEVAA